MVRRRPVTGEVATSGAVIVLALLSLWQTAVIPVSPIYARVGPTLFPWIASSGLLVIGVLLLAQALRGGFGVEPSLATDWRAVAWVAAGLAANVALIGTAGFVFAATALFVCVSRGFGSTGPLRDLAIGVVIALGAYVGFEKLLGVNIGAGILEGLI
ncbi:MAG: tripartite tricarboxylate transporter TctB family protein [Acetobacteraceae bacterium]|nr:tripartite tricarboxylate transporter TctB family protein [Acetobacteraceae bacterium]